MAKKKENKKKRLKALLLLLFLTVLLLSTSTYAWFTANRSVSINPINVQIATAAGLQISTDAANWKTVITNDDINNGYSYQSSGNTVTDINMLPYNLEPVSTAGGNTGGLLDFFKGTVAGDTNNNGVMSLTTGARITESKYVYNAQNPGTQPNFVAFDIFLKVEAEENQSTVPIYLDRGSGVTTTADHTGKGLQYASRYAFVVYDTNDTTDSLATQILPNRTVDSTKVVEPNYDGHTSTGVLHASQNYGITTTAAASGVAAVDYVGVKAQIPANSPIALINTNPHPITVNNSPSTYTPSSTYFGSISNLIKTNVAYSTTTDATYSYDGKTGSDPNLVNIFTLDPGITKIRVYMWVEGQDVDCENSASGDFLTYKIGFTLDDAE